MRIFITGITGFLGSHLARALSRRGIEVHGITRNPDRAKLRGPTGPNVFFHPAITQGYSELFRQHQPQAVFLLATNYGKHGEKCHDMLLTNTHGPLALLEATLENKVPLLIHADTCLYNWPIQYQHYLAYVLSKHQFVRWGEALCEGSDTQFFNLKIHHLYGPYDSQEKFVPQIIKACLHGHHEIPLTAGMQTKDFIYVDDVINAFTSLLDRHEEVKTRYAEFECGTGTETTLRDFVELVHRVTRSKAVLRFGAVPYRQNEIMHLKANPEKLLQLGWTTKTPLEDGIQKIIQSEYQLIRSISNPN